MVVAFLPSSLPHFGNEASRQGDYPWTNSQASRGPSEGYQKSRELEKEPFFHLGNACVLSTHGKMQVMPLAAVIPGTILCFPPTLFVPSMLPLTLTALS